MISIKINETEREFSEVNPSWIHEQINERQRAGIPVCVSISIKKNDLDMILSTGQCPNSISRGHRRPNPHEEQVFELWNKLGVQNLPINSGILLAFLQQIKHL